MPLAAIDGAEPGRSLQYDLCRRDSRDRKVPFQRGLLPSRKSWITSSLEVSYRSPIRSGPRSRKRSNVGFTKSKQRNATATNRATDIPVEHPTPAGAFTPAGVGFGSTKEARQGQAEVCTRRTEAGTPETARRCSARSASASPTEGRCSRRMRTPRSATFGPGSVAPSTNITRFRWSVAPRKTSPSASLCSRATRSGTRMNRSE